MISEDKIEKSIVNVSGQIDKRNSSLLRDDRITQYIKRLDQ